VKDHPGNRALWALAFALALALAWWLERGLYINLANTPSLKVPCLSYAPFRREGANPVRVGADITPVQIEEDLRLIKTLSECIRTYGVGKGLEAVPEIAKKLGMRVRLGVWLGRDEAANQVEMNTAIALTKKYRETIDVLIVGNEVLLRQDLSPTALTAHLKDAKSRSSVPISYADVWEFWRRQSSLKHYVDIVTIHVLPYWEDEPVAAASASAHVFDTVHIMQKEFTGHPVWLGETGWPAAGRQRAGAVPGVVEQTQVLRDVMIRASKEQVDLNLIEAFDQPWKRNLEGGMGGAWGMFRADGRLRMSFKGPVQDDAYWWRGVLGALVGVLLGAMISVSLGIPNGTKQVANTRVGERLTSRLFSRQRRAGNLVFTLGLGLIGVVAPAHLDSMALWSRDPYEWSIAIIATILVLLATLGLLWEVQGTTSEQASLINTKQPFVAFVASKSLAIGLLAVSIIWAWHLWVDPRYRGFPIALFFPAAALSVALGLSAMSKRSRRPQAPGAPIPSVQRMALFLLSLSLIALAALIMFNEGYQNTQALVMGSLWVLIALAPLQACYPKPPTKA
jgi:exo-beta-1,3-glucanase (GH17 family)